MRWADWKLRLRALLLRRRVEEELDEEVEFHLAMQARKNLAKGMSAVDATHRARAEFGGLQQVKEACRDARRLYWIETAFEDARYALRGFRRTPAFALTVAATIALALGLNTTVFTIFNAYVLRPLSVRDPYSLYLFTWRNRSGNGHLFTWQEFEDFGKQNAAFSEVMALDHLQVRVAGRMMFGHLVTGNYFRALGVEAVLGRTLLPEDTATPGSGPIVVVSFAAWRNKFGGDPGIIGRKLIIHGYPLEVVGVAREGFTGLSPVPLDFWAPLTMAPQLEEGASLFGPEHPEQLRIVGRLRRGWSLGQAEAALSTWAQQRTAGRPDPEKATGAILRSQATTVPLDPYLMAGLMPIFVAFGLVLLIACANVANMMLARAMARQREIGIRLAMGAARSRLIRQLLTEALLLALPAAAAAFGIAKATIAWGVELMFATLPHDFLEFITLLPLEPDWRVLGFMLAAAVVSALLFGLVPAIQATRSNVMQAARGEFTTDFRPARLRNALVIGQVTVSAVFLICAAVLLRANNRIARIDVGLKAHRVVEIEVHDKFRSKVIQQLGTEPVVESLAAASKVPFMGMLANVPVAPDDTSERIRARYLYVSPEYFRVFEVPILRGRNFTSEEAKAGAPVAVISQATAQRFWPGRDALGQILRIEREPKRSWDLTEYGAGAPPYPSVRVIGIARDGVNGWVADGTDPTCIYFSNTPQSPGSILFASVKGDAERARRKLDTALAATVPGAVDQIHAMDEILAAQLYPFRAAYWVSSAVSGLALLLTLSGIYGVLSYLVTQRTKEIGIRVALGASTGSVARLVLRQSMKLAATGTAIGALAAVVVIRLVASAIELAMFNEMDGPALAMGALTVIAASACAAWLPSRRAARIEPVTTLRYD